MDKEAVKFVVFVPLSHADSVREALGTAGAGKVGNYDFSSFSVKGIGRFRPIKGAKPVIGKVGKFESVEEERIEVICSKQDIEKIVDAVKKVHPYEEIAYDVYPLLVE